MSKKINLYWYQHKEGHGNFGDALNPYIVEKLSGVKPKFYNINLLSHSKFLNFKVLLKNLITKNLSFYEFIDYLIYDYFRHKNVVLAIGSVLRYENGKRLIVWGSGIIKKDAIFGNCKFLAVRGHYTRRRIIELGYKAPDIVGDPAILLPRVYQSENDKNFKLGVIPHFIHYEELKQVENNDVKVINLLDPIEKVIDDICSCNKTISTSLHGLIVSHAYQVPSLWFDFETESKLFGDNIKFKDYFSSVGIKNYQPINIDFKNFELSKIEEQFHINETVKAVSIDTIKQIQESLISCAPF